MSPSRDVEYSALNADVHCGAGTKQILYLEPGTLISRRVSWSDLYDQETGDLIVMYTAARRSDSRHARYACAAQRLLELNVPSFTFGTDLVLPVSANEDLRIILLNRAADGGEYRVEDGTEYDLEDDWEREFEYWPRDMERALAMVSGLEDIFLPQVGFAFCFGREGREAGGEGGGGDLQTGLRATEAFGGRSIWLRNVNRLTMTLQPKSHLPFKLIKQHKHKRNAFQPLFQVTTSTTTPYWPVKT